MDELLKQQGFEGITDFKEISDRLMARGIDVFMKWRDQDGTKAGALKLLERIESEGSSED